MKRNKTILQITPFFEPNIGGVETHLSDLVSQLDKRNYRCLVLTYSPLSTPNTKWKKTEKYQLHSHIYRFKWPGGNIFHKLEKFPLLNLLYISPYLLLRSIIFLISKRPHIDVIHSHGINGAIIGNILQRLFHIKKHVVSIYSTYDNVPLNSFSTKMVVYILNKSNHVLTQSDSSVLQLIRIGVDSKKLSRYYHWVDLNIFKPVVKQDKKFSILFVGRMIPPKNALVIAKIAHQFPKYEFVFVGTGPDFSKIEKISKNSPNIKLVGDVPYAKLHAYYQQSNLLVVPSKYHEGWGRIIAESVSCGAPVISSNLGGTMEAADTSVAIFIKPTADNFSKEIKKLQSDPSLYKKLIKNCRPYALKHYSNKNLSYITKNY